MSKRHYDWRKGRKIHEAADRFPMMGPQQLDELAADIKANGLTLPPVYFVTKAGERLLVDGRNRLEACCRAGINPDVEGNEIHEGKVDPYSYVISANIRRRHLSNTQKRHLIAWLIAKQPQKSDRAIAKDVDASHHTVASVRRSNGQNAHKSADRRETSGKLTRGRKPGASAPKKKPNASPPIRPSETAPTTTATTSPAE